MKYQETEILCTDGSEKYDLVGIGIRSKDYSEFHRLGNLCSMFSAEAAAILQARLAPLLIVSDSAGVLDALQTPSNEHHFVQEIQELLNDCRNEVTFMWEPSYCSIKGNEEVDNLDSLGRDGALLTPKIPGDDVKMWLNRYRIREARAR